MKKENEEKFTIIITTRDRCDTLFFTLKTCLDIDYDNFEILVSDNCSVDDTKNVVEKFNSKKIRYVNTNKKVSMTENWEFAVSHVKDGFITIIGDDDGFLKNSLTQANSLIKKTNTKALVWKKIEYCWPNHIYPSLRGYLSIPLSNNFIEMSSAKSLDEFYKMKMGYNQLPCIYNSFISKDVISNALNNSKNGFLFNSRSPDVYSAVVFSLFTDKYIYTETPLSVNGASKHSNGTAQRFKQKKATEAELFNKENEESVRISSFFKYPQGLVATEQLNALIQLKKNYPILLTDRKIDMRKFLRAIANEYSMMSRKTLSYSNSLNELLEYSKNEGIKEEIEEIVKNVVETGLNPKVEYGLKNQCISFNSMLLNIHDVSAAAKLSYFILRFTKVFSKFKLKKILNKVGLLVIIKKLKSYLLYKKEYQVFKSTHEERFLVEDKDKSPCLDDKNGTTSFDKHYTYHTAWAARKVKEINPKEHVDISSLTYFSTLVSAFIPIRFYDYRPAIIELEDFSCNHADITELPFENNEIHSLSCMHVVEHIGLGRYGDPLDVDGDLKAIEELKRVVSVDGYLLFVVPIGKAKIMFNAHRIYSYKQVLEYFDTFELLEFTLIPDQSSEGLIINATEEQSDIQNYACGCFMFKKKGSI
jgi:glycosyltransferase involved in cell wall biosynthesis